MEYAGGFMEKIDYIKLAKKKLKNRNAKQIMLEQIDNYFLAKETYMPKKSTYKVGDYVVLKKGTLLHGTFKNIEGLKEIVKNGLVSSWFTGDRTSKYPSSVGVWNLKKDYLLKDYINFYSGGTIAYKDNDGTFKTEVIPFDNMKNIMKEIVANCSYRWDMEQTKEARFMPSLVQERVQIGIIFNGNCKEIKPLLKNDVLSNSINDKDVKEFINPYYYQNFIVDRKEKDDFFTDRESAIIFGIPSNLIEGILVGREYEKEDNILEEIKSLLPDCYICNLDGIVIKK